MTKPHELNVNNKIPKQAFSRYIKDTHSFSEVSSVVRLEVRGPWVELRKQRITKNKSITNNGSIVRIVGLAAL